MHGGAAPDRALALVDALYAFAQEPERWLDAIEAIERLPPVEAGANATARLAAHAERAAALADELNAARRAARTSVPWDALLLSADGTLRATTGAAEARLRPFLAVPLAPFAAPVFRPAVRAAVDAALTAARAGRHGGFAHLTLCEEEARAFAIVLSRDVFPRDLSAAFGLSDAGPEPLFALAALSETSGTARERLRTSFGLTRAEWRLAEQLRTGAAVGDAAAALGISVNTARTQVKAIYTKLGVSRQSELVSRLSLTERLDLSEVRAAHAQTEAPARRFVVLDDGRRIAYREYGDAHGAPVIVFHQWFSSSLVPREQSLALFAPADVRIVPRQGLLFDQAAYRDVFDWLT